VAIATPVPVIPPNSVGSEWQSRGFLVVNTPAELHFDELSRRRFPHTGYSIYDSYTHKLLEYVPNRLGRAGETPTQVLLPAGMYFVEARTPYHQPVLFPVLIRPQTETTVNLDNDVPPPNTITGDFYTLQCRGRSIGWLEETAINAPPPIYPTAQLNPKN
jgi:hypothetical protein